MFFDSTALSLLIFLVVFGVAYLCKFSCETFYLLCIISFEELIWLKQRFTFIHTEQNFIQNAILSPFSRSIIDELLQPSRLARCSCTLTSRARAVTKARSCLCSKHQIPQRRQHMGLSRVRPLLVLQLFQPSSIDLRNFSAFLRTTTLGTPYWYQ